MARVDEALERCQASYQVFHATDAQNLHGEFEGWKEDDRDNLVKRILPVIAGTDCPGIVIGVHMDEFRNAISHDKELAGFFGTPFAACFHWVVQSLMYLQVRTGNRERIALTRN
jgi:hypothetical protein